LPNFEDLEKIALKLFRAYTSSRGQYRAMHDPNGENEWSKIIPQGSPWTGPLPEESSAKVGITSRKAKGLKAKTMPTPHQESSAGIGVDGGKQPREKKGPAATMEKDELKGDRVLARSIAFIRESMWARECAYAVAEGDARRVYEILKVNPRGSSVMCAC
jgi:hypothetical protein